MKLHLFKQGSASKLMRSLTKAAGKFLNTLLCKRMTAPPLSESVCKPRLSPLCLITRRELRQSDIQNESSAQTNLVRALAIVLKNAYLWSTEDM